MRTLETDSASHDTSAARIAYVAYAFPVLTQTFTAREVSALRRHGLDVQVYSARQGEGAALDPEAGAEARRAVYLGSPLAPGTLAAFVGWLLRRPLRTAATAVACLGGRYAHDGLRCRLRAPLHVLLGAVLAREVRARGGVRRIHAQFLDAGSTVALVAARLLDVPFSFANHTAYNPFQPRLKCRHADLIVSISSFDRDLLLAQSDGAADPSGIRVSRVGIPLAEWAGLERRPEAGRVLTVGAFREKKGHAVLLRAAGRLVRGGAGLRLAFAGDGPEAASLRSAADREGVPVEFLGAVGPARVREEMARAAVFALPCVVARNGDLDGVPVALMEAMAAGLPVVSTRLSGIPELVEDGRSGLLVPPGDDEALAEAIRRFLGDAEFAASCGRRARERVAELHDLEHTSRHLASLLAEGVR